MPTNAIALQFHRLPHFNNQSTTEICAYFAVYSNYKDWRGCTIYISEDNGITYISAGSIVKQSIVGICTTTLCSSSLEGRLLNHTGHTAPIYAMNQYTNIQNNSSSVINVGNYIINPFLLDTYSILEVSIPSASIEEIFSISDADFYNYFNLSMVGEEIVAFRDVEVIGRQTVRLKTFLRGRFGTENKMQHFRGKAFILLTENSLIKATFIPTSIGNKIIALCASNGQPIEDALKIEFTLDTKSISDLPPTDEKCEKDENGNFNISFIPRTKNTTTFYDVELPVVIQYGIIINQNNIGIRQILPTLGNNIMQCTYTIEMQIDDFDTPQSVISYSVVGL